MIKFPCQVCEKPVATNRNATCCDVCDFWIHIYCNDNCKQIYKQLQKFTSHWYCKSFLKKEIPVSNLNNGEFEAFASGLSILSKKETAWTKNIWKN